MIGTMRFAIITCIAAPRAHSADFLQMLPVNATDTLPAGKAPATPSIFVVPLTKQYVPVLRGNVTLTHKTAYFGTVYVGSPRMQAFSVVFDTGSGHFILPSEACTSASCQEHRRYKRGASHSVRDVDYAGSARAHSKGLERDTVQIQYGTGEIEGEFVNELACLRDHSEHHSAAAQDDCIRVRLITATNMTDAPFREFKFDGVVGLGLESLALQPEFSFFGQIARAGRLAQTSFSVFISSRDSVASEIAFGGQDPRHIGQGQALQWAPVAKPELGYWQVSIKAVSVGHETLPWCAAGDCVGVLDTGTSLLGVPKAQLKDLHWLLARLVPQSAPGLDCRNAPGPNITFHLGDFNLTLGPEDYSRPMPLQINSTKTNKSQIVCRASLLPVDMAEAMGNKVWILGEPLLRKYYTTYDWGRKQIGFAPSAQTPEMGVSSGRAAEQSGLGSPTGKDAPTSFQI